MASPSELRTMTVTVVDYTVQPPIKCYHVNIHCTGVGIGMCGMPAVKASDIVEVVNLFHPTTSMSECIFCLTAIVPLIYQTYT